MRSGEADICKLGKSLSLECFIERSIKLNVCSWTCKILQADQRSNKNQVSDVVQPHPAILYDRFSLAVLS